MTPRLHPNTNSEPMPTSIRSYWNATPVRSGLQFQVPSVNSQVIQIPGHEQKPSIYEKSRPTTRQFQSVVDWNTCDGKRTQQCVTPRATGDPCEGMTGAIIYSNNSYVNPVAQNLNTTSPYPYGLSSAIASPTAGTPLSIGSPLPFYGNLVGSPRIQVPNYNPYATQFTTPRSVKERSSFSFVAPFSPQVIDCSELLSSNSSIQQNRLTWPVSPAVAVNATPSLTSPFTLQQQMPNLSINDGASNYINGTLGNEVVFTGCQSEAVRTPRNQMTESWGVRGGTSVVTFPREEPGGNYNKLNQFPGGEIKKDVASQITYPISKQGVSPRYKCSSLQSYSTMQPYAINPTPTHLPTQDVPVAPHIVQCSV